MEQNTQGKKEEIDKEFIENLLKSNGGRSCRKCLTLNIQYESYRLCQG